MKILVTGGSGFVGRPLCEELRNSGHEVIVTTRRKVGANGRSPLQWNPPELIPSEVTSKIDAVINLAGEPIAPKRWTDERKKRILSSRIKTTRALVQSIEKAESKPKILISASAIGYYGPHGDEYVTEDTPAGSDFLADVCKEWEDEAYKAEELGVRVVTVRIGGVLEADGGALSQMMIPFKFFVGGPIGNGRQWFSWIHRDDVVGIMRYALENDSVSGPVNATAPEPVTNKEFSHALGRAMCRPSFLAVPGFMVKLTLGELGSVLLTGQRVIPEKAMNAGYTFRYPEVNGALKAILSRK